MRTVSVVGDGLIEFVNGKATVATLDVLDGNQRLVTVQGLALKDEHDDFDETIGAHLALGRALEQAGRKLQRRAEGMIRHQENQRAAAGRRNEIFEMIRDVMGS